MSLEDVLLEKYEEEFSKYCFDVLDITNGDAFLYKLEDGETFWNWLEEYHYDEWHQLELEDIDRQMKFMHKEAV